ncbi:hypothetical protein [Geodermatophilus sp. SYSU D00766]
MPLFFIAFAVGNPVGPFALGHLFDTVGRRRMIAFTYVLSGVLLAITAVLFQAGVLNAITQTIAWSIIFFFASAGASSAYLTVSEIFPLEVRPRRSPSSSPSPSSSAPSARGSTASSSARGRAPGRCSSATSSVPA